jgi:type II protein arginine methyltransferase
MMDDKPRNSAYRAAIARAVQGKRVLDIGTGSGLLAMMAARAGALTVTACESVGLIADRARDIVALNGLASRVKVIPKSSTELVPGRDLPERAEVLITETFTSGLLGEGIFPTLEHAHQHLLTPDAAVIPAAGSVRGYLAGGDTLKGLLFADRIEDFNLTPFNDFAPPVLATSLDGVPHDALSDDLELLRFDFREKSFPIARRPMRVTATKPGLCIGIAQWMRIELDRETSYENRPAPSAHRTGHWTHMLYRFPKLLRLRAGDVVAIEVSHNRSQVNIDLVE